MKQQEHPTLDLGQVREKPSTLRKVVKVLIILGVIFGVLLAGTVIYANFYVHGKFKATHNDNITAIDPFPPGSSYNILVLGSDRRDVVDKSERDERQYRGGSGRRADTIFLIHVPANQKSAVILSFPRDLRVKIPGRSGFSRINAAYGGGPNLMINTVKSITGLKVNHYIEVNFASFQKVVDAVGGVDLCVPRAYNDKQSGLIVGKGCRTFGGKLALAYVRMRKSDPNGDFGRIDRQQRFMRALMGKVTSVGFLTDLPRLFRLADAISKGVITDSKLSLGEVKGIANKLAGFKQSNVDFRVVPSFPKYIGGVAYVVEKTREAKALYAALRTDSPLPDFGKTGASIPKPEDVTIRLENGTTTDGLASTVRTRLRKLGFVVKSTGNARRRNVSRTVIFFQPGDEPKAKLIAEEFPGADVREATSPQSTDIVVVLGADEAARASPSPSAA